MAGAKWGWKENAPYQKVVRIELALSVCQINLPEN